MAIPAFRFAEIGGGKIRYVDAGHGPSVLLIHGSYGSWSHWTENVVPLSQRARVIAPDLPGFGASMDAPVSADLQYFARCLQALLSDLGVDEYCVCGYSFGGLIAAELARANPGKVRAALLMSPPVLGTPHVVRELQGQIGRLALRGALKASVQVMLEHILLHRPHRRTAEAVSITIENLRRARFRARALQDASSLSRLVEGISCPLSALLGERDPFYGGAVDVAVQALQAIKPGTSACIARDAAHWVCYDDPEGANEAILRMVADRDRLTSGAGLDGRRSVDELRGSNPVH